MSSDEEEAVVPILWSLLLNIENNEKKKDVGSSFK